MPNHEDQKKASRIRTAIRAAFAVLFPATATNHNIERGKSDGESEAADVAPEKTWPQPIKEALENGSATYEPSDDPAHWKPKPKGKPDPS